MLLHTHTPILCESIMPSPPAVLGTATLFCRPLRLLFDVENTVAVLRNDNDSTAPSPRDQETVLGHVHVHVSIATPDDDESSKFETLPQFDELMDLVGRFVRVRVRLQVPDGSLMRRWRVQYQLSPATESFLLPADHTNTFRVLVTDDLVTHVGTSALQFRFLTPKQHDDEQLDDHGRRTEPVDPAPTAAVPVMPQSSVSAEEAEAARRLTEAAAVAAETAAQAAREAARAATTAMQEAKAVAYQRESDRDAQVLAQATREHEREQQLAQELARERERASAQVREAQAQAKSQAAASLAMEKQQYDRTLETLSDEKRRLSDDAARLRRVLEEKESAMAAWQQQTATTDAALELLKQRLEGDAREREELQRRLRVLEEEKLELMRKSRACIVQ